MNLNFILIKGYFNDFVLCSFVSKIQRLIVLLLINNSLPSSATELNCISVLFLISIKITGLPLQFSDIFFFLVISESFTCYVFLCNSIAIVDLLKDLFKKDKDNLLLYIKSLEKPVAPLLYVDQLANKLLLRVGWIIRLHIHLFNNC